MFVGTSKSIEKERSKCSLRNGEVGVDRLRFEEMQRKCKLTSCCRVSSASLESAENTQSVSAVKTIFDVQCVRFIQKHENIPETMDDTRKV